MKLLSPVNSIESAKIQIEAGADEIYVGLQTDYYNSYSFSGRGQFGKNKSIVPSEAELKKIVDISHRNNVQVSLAANTPIFSDSLIKKSHVMDEYLRYIDRAIGCSVDNIIVGDIGLLSKLGRMNLPAKIHASTYFDTMNIEQMLFLKELGASRVVLTYQSSMDEIERFCATNLLEIEVFGYLGCSFFNGACNLIHNMGEEIKKEGKQISIPCKALYNVWSDDIKEINTPYLDAELGCALCSVYKLIELGVDVLKIAGRDRNTYMIREVTKLFKKAISIAKTSDSSDYHKKLQEEIYDWWKKAWCTHKRCKYMNNKITNSYIGL